MPKPGVPESFKVLIKELQSLGLDMKVLDKFNNEIDLKQNFDEDDNMGFYAVDDPFTLDLDEEAQKSEEEDELDEEMVDGEDFDEEGDELFEALDFGLDDLSDEETEEDYDDVTL